MGWKKKVQDEAMDMKMNKLKKDSMKKKVNKRTTRSLWRRKCDDDEVFLLTYQLEEKNNNKKEEDNNVEWQIDILIEVVNHYITKLFIVVTNEILLLGDNKEKVEKYFRIRIIPKETINSRILLKKSSLKKTNPIENTIKIFEVLSNIK